jgi:integrase
MEAADNGLMAPELASGIARIKGVPSRGVRVGNLAVAPTGWTTAAAVTEGYLFRPINGANRISGNRLSEKVVWQMFKGYAIEAGIRHIAPHHLRRTTAKLCRAAGSELEQIQLLLGHASVQTTERYLGTKQDLVHAPNDAIKLKLNG